MTIRENIRAKIETDFAKMTVANGYVHELAAADIFTSLQGLEKDGTSVTIELGADQGEMNEAGIETNLKVYIYCKFRVDTDIGKIGTLSDEAEIWFRDLDRMFMRPTNPSYVKSKMSDLWEVDGVDYYFISLRDPIADNTKENIGIVGIELTIFYINGNA